jgi:hypothetical protein
MTRVLHPSGRTFALGLLLAVVACVCSAWACTPSQQQRAVEAAPFVERVLCVVLRAASTDGTVSDICATADELAPLVPQLLAQRAEGSAPPPAAPLLAAFKMPAPSKRTPKRRCVAWMPLPAGTSGTVDASSEGGRDASPE